MKRTVTISTALSALVIAVSQAAAADLPPRPVYVPPAPIPIYNWTGFYLGGNLGGAWASGTLSNSFTGASFTGNHSSFIGGGQVGYNWQVAPTYVVGIEGMFDWTSLKSGGGTVSTGAGVLQGGLNTKSISTIAARFGTAQNNWLFYGKAGGGWVNNTAYLNNLTTGIARSGSNTNSGWVLGAGVEYGLTQNWTIKGEYDFIGLRDWTFAGPVAGSSVNVARQINMFTVGMNYKF